MARNVRCWSFRWSHSGDTTVIRFGGEGLRLDEEGVAALADELLRLGRHELCLDFRHIRSLDGYAVAMLRVWLEAAGRAVHLADCVPLRPVAKAVSGVGPL